MLKKSTIRAFELLECEFDRGFEAGEGGATRGPSSVERMQTLPLSVLLQTQFMLVEGKHEVANEETVYAMFLTLLEGQIYGGVTGNERDEVEICHGNGDELVKTKQGKYLVYMHAGTNSFEVINQAVKMVEKNL